MRPKGIEDLAKALDVSPAWLAFGDNRIDQLSKPALEVAFAFDELDEQDRAALQRMLEALRK